MYWANWIILFYSTSSINLVMNLHEFNKYSIYHIPPKRTLNCTKNRELWNIIFHWHAHSVTLMFSVISILLNGFIALMHRVIFEKTLLLNIIDHAAYVKASLCFWHYNTFSVLMLRALIRKISNMTWPDINIPQLCYHELQILTFMSVSGLRHL